MPLSCVGKASPLGPGSVVMVTAAVFGSTLIRERTSTMPRSNGPAFASVATSSPNGAPS